MTSSNSFAVWLPRFLNNLKTKNCSPRTIEGYEIYLTQFAWYKTYIKEHDGVAPQTWEQFHRCGLAGEIDTDIYQLEDYFVLLTNERQLKPASIQLRQAAIGSFYRYLVKIGVVETNPADKLDRPKIKDRELKYLRHEDMMHFINSIKNPKYKLLVRTIYATGMRVSEICNLQAQHIDFSAHTIRVNGKGGKVRTVFCDAETLELLREWIGDKQEGYVFPAQTNELINRRTIEKWFVRNAPEGITPHKVRHSYATELYRRSKNLKVVQETLGHNSLETTQVYVHTDLEEMHKQYQAYHPLESHSL